MTITSIMYRKPAVRLLCLLFTLFIACNSESLKCDAIIADMQRVANYELANPSTHYSKDDAYNYVNGWIPSTFYVSLIPLYEATNDDKYLKAVKKWGKESNWDCAPRFRHADDLVCGQIYLDLYRHEKEQKYVDKLMVRMDSLIATRIEGSKDWSWCDALFMAPPVYMMAGDILNDKKYSDYADDMYWDVYDFLFDENERLFYRDKNYFIKLSPNGQKVFWGRGNGWVLGGLARLIPYVKDKEIKEKYENLFRAMASRIIDFQQEDGLWRSNLLDKNHFPQKETSASGFYVYALAWGINNGILEAEVYKASVVKGWKSLCECINDETGMLGWVQPIGAAPGDTNATTTKSYGAGAFILAGTEVLKLVD